MCSAFIIFGLYLPIKRNFNNAILQRFAIILSTCKTSKIFEVLKRKLVLSKCLPNKVKSTVENCNFKISKDNSSYDHSCGDKKCRSGSN